MSNKFLIKFIFISLIAIIKAFEIEIINTGGVDNSPFGMFGPPNNVMNQIINDIEKDMEKSFNNNNKANFLTPLGQKQSKSKLPHRHKEIIEVNGPGFKSVEIREVISPEDSNKSIKSTPGLFDHKIQSEKNVENVIEKALDQLENEILNEPQQNPFENMINNLFAPSLHDPVIFVKEKRNLKHDQIIPNGNSLVNGDHHDNISKEEPKMEEFSPIKIFSGLNEIVNGFMNLGDTAFKKLNKNNDENLHVINNDNLSLNISNAAHSSHVDSKNLNVSDKSAINKAPQKPKINNHVNITHKRVPNKNGPKPVPSHYKHPTFPHANPTHKQIPKIPPSVIPIASTTPNIIHNTTSIGITRESSYFESVFNYNDQVMKYVYYSLIGLFAIICAVYFLYQIIQRESELRKLDKNHSINQIEDELKKMKDKNKLY